MPCPCPSPTLRGRIGNSSRRRDTTIPDNPDWRRHRGACTNYREHWSAENEPGDDGCRLLYQVICLMNTPPLTVEEQQRCLCTTQGCWREPQTSARETVFSAANFSEGRSG